MYFILFKLSWLLKITRFVKNQGYNVPYESTELGVRGNIYASPAEVSTDMEKQGLFEKAEKLIKEK